MEHRPVAAAETMCLVQLVHHVMRRQQKLSYHLKPRDSNELSALETAHYKALYRFTFFMFFYACEFVSLECFCHVLAGTVQL